MYPPARAAWEANSRAAHADLEGYMAGVGAYLTRKAPKYFRWHVAGDILSQEYLKEMVLLSHSHPSTRFLVFTKRFDLDYSDNPANLSVVFSMWPGMPAPNREWTAIQGAWMQDGTEVRVPETAIECPGTCDTCGMCWQLSSLGRDVVFHKH